MSEILGSCICGSIRYSASGELRNIIGCHCKECRKFSGHFTAATSVRPNGLDIQSNGALKWYRSSPIAQRGFCKNCGCSLFFKTDDGDRISIFVGSVDGEVTLPFSSHIYLKEKGSYYEINDDAEQFLTVGAKLSLK